MKKILIILIFFCSNPIYGSSLFDTDFYEINFTSDNVDYTKLQKLNEIKFLSINDILNKILTKKDFIIMSNSINEDIINSFIKNIIFEDEKIINNNYYSKIKINYNKKSIISFIRSNNLQYVEFLPNNFLTIIYNKDIINKSLLSKNNRYYQYLLSNNYSLYMLPNLDLNDRYLLTFNDIEKQNINKIKKFSEKYNKSEILIIISEQNNKNIFYKFFLIINNKINEFSSFYQNKIDYQELFTYLDDEVLDYWKVINGIQNKYLNTLNCSIQYFNLLELKEIIKNMNNILSIEEIKLLNFSYLKKVYKISFYGNDKILFDLFNLNNLKIDLNKNVCKISLI